MLLGSCSNKEERTEEVEIGFVGRARLDPFYAATEFLLSEGRVASSQQNLPANLDRDTTLMFVPANAVSGKATFDRVSRWVRAGGALVICIEGSERYNDWNRRFSEVFADEGQYDAIANRLREVGLVLHTDTQDEEMEFVFSADEESSSVGEDPSIEDFIAEASPLGTGEIMWQGYNGEKLNFVVEIPGSIKVSKIPRSFSGSDSVPGGFASTSFGRGSISVLTHAQPLRSRYLADHDHAAFLLQLAGQTEDWGEVLFVYGSPGSFWSLLWERYWRVLVALILVILIWLWKAGSRFGPVQLIDEQGHRMTRFQLMLSGGFFGKEGQTAVLISAAQERAKRQAMKGRPHLHGLQGKDLSREIAKILRLDEKKVTEAMGPSAGLEPRLFTAHMQTLQIITQKLKAASSTNHSSSQTRPS